MFDYHHAMDEMYHNFGTLEDWLGITNSCKMEEGSLWHVDSHCILRVTNITCFCYFKQSPLYLYKGMHRFILFMRQGT